MRTPRPVWAVIGISVGACVLAIAIALWRWPLLVTSLRQVVGVAFVLVLPGLVATFLLSPIHPRNRAWGALVRDHERDLDVVERAMLAIPFSMIITSSVVFVFAKYRAALFTDPTLTPQRLAYGIIGTTIILILLALARQRQIPWWIVIGMFASLVVIMVLRSFGVLVTAELTVEFLVAIFTLLTAFHVRRTVWANARIS